MFINESSKKSSIVYSFLPITVLIANLVIAFIYGNGGYDFSGVTIPQTYGLEAVKQKLYIFFNWNWFGQIIIPLFIIGLIYQILYFVKSNNKK